jgi:tRNA(Leu) C34 or U34 (ribose-2'-O)-methylase TrmL
VYAERKLLGQKQPFAAGDVLLFGPERSAWPQHAIRACAATARIPVSVGSLNVGVAVGIGVYEAIRQVDGQGGSRVDGMVHMAGQTCS